MTNDFWEINLPSNLATSASRSPSLFAYEAALVTLEALALFSIAKVGDMLDPAIQANRSAVERHHLFPSGYLAKLNITATRERNQIANYAFVEWGDNTSISDQAPANYLTALKERFSESDMRRMYHYHALPEHWEQMEYWEFLERRQELMAKVIREGYEKIAGGSTVEQAAEELDVTELIASGESDAVEFKSTLRINLHTGKADSRMEHTVLKTLAGFLNTRGGKLVIGVADDGTPVGIDKDNFLNEDHMGLHLVNIGNDRMGSQAMTSVHAHFDDYEDSRVMVVECQRSPVPVYLNNGGKESFFIRTGPSTRELTVSEVQGYIKQKFGA